MAIDEIAKGLTTTTARTAQPIQEEEKKNVFLDILAAPFRGIEGAAQGVYNLADWATGDELLPDYDNRFLGRSNTIAGGLVEGVTVYDRFYSCCRYCGYKFGTIASKVGTKTALKVAKGKKNFNYAELRQLKGLKKKGKLGETLKYTSSGAVADFTVFDAQEERLSNLINMNPALKNPVTEYLAADGEDGEIEGRLKNVIEGLFIEAGMGAVVVPFIKSLKMLKSRNKKMAEGKDKVQATQEALTESELRQDEIDNAREAADNEHNARDGEEDTTGSDYQPEYLDTNFDDLSYKQLQDEALRQGLSGRGTKEEIKQRLVEKIQGINTKSGFDEQFKDLTYRQLQEEAKRQGVSAKGKKDDIIKRLQEKAKETNKEKSPLDMTDEEALKTGTRVGGGVKNPEKVDAEGKAEDVEVSPFKDVETGGTQALRSNSRLIRTSIEAATLAFKTAEARVKQLKAEGKVPKTTAKELTQQSEEFASIMGGDVNSWRSRINKLEEDAGKYQQVLEEQRVIREMQESIAESIRDKAKAYKEAEAGNGVDLDEARTDLFSALDQFTEVQRMWSLYGRTLSLGMLQRKFMYKGGFKTRNFGFDTAKNKSRAAQQAYRNQAKGSMSEKKLVNLLAMASQSDDIAGTLTSLNKLNMKMRGRLLFDMNREYWINALLSAPTTQMVNILGNMITYALRTAETTTGALLTGNWQLAKSQLNLAYHMQSVAEAFKLAITAMKTDEAVTIANHRVFDDSSSELHSITSDNLNKITGGRMDESGLLYKSFNWLGTIARFPSRGLLGGDEFFKALSYRHYLRTELSVQAMNKGIKDPKQIAEYVQKGFDSHITESGRAFSEENILRDATKIADERGLTFAKRQDFIDDYMERHYIRDEDMRIDENGVAYKVGSVKQREDLSGRAAQYAKVNSHTQDAEIGSLKTLSKLIAENPWMTFVVPFVRTPTNILTFGVSRSPLAAAQVLNPFSYAEGGSMTKLFKKEYMDKMNTANARERAEFAGRLATAISVTAALYYYTLANKDFITGYGAKNKERRDSEKLGGFQEYSIRIPREGKPDLMLSYQRLDPLATILGICADMAEYSEYDESGTTDQLSLIFSNLASTVVNNITNKSYVQGLDNLFNVLRDPTKNGEKFIGNIAGGYVPNILNQSMNYQEDRMLRETRGMLDYMIKRTPMADKLMPRRNLLGEIETMPTSGLQGVFNPIYQKEVPDSIVEQEIGNMKTGFSKPSELLGNNKNLDMRDFVNEEGGQTAYDRYLELTGLVKINNMTLRQALEKLMRSSTYEAIPDAEILLKQA